MDDDYTPPNEMCKTLQHIIDSCQHWMKIIKDAEGTSKEKYIMEEFDAVDIYRLLLETDG